MRIAFYAPLKPPSHPRPSGDRRMARLLMAALEGAGHRVELASRLRSFEGYGDARQQGAIAGLAAAAADRLIRRYRNKPRRQRPALWFTYHAYYKAPDWIGPRVSLALGIPYVLAETSHAPKRARGPWADGHRQTEKALGSAALIVVMNPADRSCLVDLLGSGRRLLSLPPFIDAQHFEAPTDRQRSRRRIARRHGLDPGAPWLLAVGMMRPGDKIRSYRLLARALGRIAKRRWQLIVVGAGEGEGEVREAFAGLGARIVYTGALTARRLASYYACADLFVWPAISEAYGMALLEAQASGLPAVAGRAGGVAQIVRHGKTGLLAPEGDAGAFAKAVARLLDAPARAAAMGIAAREKAMARHDLASASDVLAKALARLAP
jgi:glycosyltransferase involved in cell wall biosynthesis